MSNPRSSRAHHSAMTHALAAAATPAAPAPMMQAAAAPAQAAVAAAAAPRRLLGDDSPSAEEEEEEDGADAELSALSLSTREGDSACIMPFELGNPAVEVIQGRLYLSEPPPEVGATEEEEEIEEEDDEEFDAPQQQRVKQTPINKHQTCLVYLLDIPAHITLNELHSFLLESPDFGDLLHMQLIRLPCRRSDSHSDATYAALLQFRTPEAAQTFVTDFHGATYNSLEPDTCVAGFVQRVQFEEADRYAFPLPSTTAAIVAGTPVPSAAATPATSAAAAASSAALPPPMLLGKQLLLAKQNSREGIGGVHSPSFRGGTPSPALLSSAPSPSLGGSCSGSASASLLSANSLLLPPIATALTSSVSTSDASSSLPSCPVCLEAIHPAASSLCNSQQPQPSQQPQQQQQQHTPMLTILCHHVFHLDCLSKWIPSSSSSSCPVCRYRMQPNVHTQCSTCKATDRLWMCIVCGHVGCSRYALGHAHKHFMDTSHNYAIEVLTQRVWDYTADCYVHRLVRNKTDGKLVELSRASMHEDERSERAPTAGGGAGYGSGTGGGADGGSGGKDLSSLHSSSASTSSSAGSAASSTLILPSSSAYASVKLEEFLLEYNYLLSSQLDQQRRVFQQALKATTNDMKKRREAGEALAARSEARRDELAARLAQAERSNQETNARLNTLNTSHAAMQAQSVQLHALHTRLLSDHSSLRSTLATAASVYSLQQDALLAAQDRSIAGLEEQVHDLAFFLDTQKKISKLDARQGRAAGDSQGLRAQLSNGQAQLQFVEVTPEEEEKGKKMRRKRGQGIML